jgi:hypothetical protein
MYGLISGDCWRGYQDLNYYFISILQLSIHSACLCLTPSDSTHIQIALDKPEDGANLDYNTGMQPMPQTVRCCLSSLLL